MDFLNGYDSGSSTDEAEVETVPQPQQSSSKLQEQQAQPNVAAVTTGAPQPKNVQRGKKILSLASVLPPHILERLTAAEEDSSDEDDFVYDKKSGKEAAPNASSKATNNDSMRETRSEISSLLSSLKETKPEHSSALKASSLLSTTVPPSELTRQPERMGAAFLSSTVTTTTQKGLVQDIHASHDLTTSANLDDESTLVSGAVPSLVSRPIVSAAPRIRSAPPTTYQPPPPSAVAVAAPRTPPSRLINETKSTRTTTAPRSRKALERALRHGHVSEVWNHEPGLARIQGADPSQYQPDAPVATATENSGTVRNVTTSMYDPSVGAAVAVGGGGGMMHAKGKNQINQLLQQAAALEKERAERPTQQKIHRANAKRKYGW